jgi:hypothetical protein
MISSEPVKCALLVRRSLQCTCLGKTASESQHGTVATLGGTHPLELPTMQSLRTDFLFSFQQCPYFASPYVSGQDDLI